MKIHLSQFINNKLKLTYINVIYNSNRHRGIHMAAAYVWWIITILSTSVIIYTWYLVFFYPSSCMALLCWIPSAPTCLIQTLMSTVNQLIQLLAKVLHLHLLSSCLIFTGTKAIMTCRLYKALHWATLESTTNSATLQALGSLHMPSQHNNL